MFESVKKISSSLFSVGAVLLLALGFFVAQPGKAEAGSNATECFCHHDGNNPPKTICTSNSGEQHGHLNHGDAPFGCECGDDVCDPTLGEDCNTCPQDCGPCP